MRWVNEARLEELLNQALKNEYSSFYWDKYAAAGVSTVTKDNFFSLPLLERQELVYAPLSERTFVPKADVRFAAFTSGTSAQRPLITPFAHVDDYHFEPSLGVDIKRPLIIYPPLNKNFGQTFVQQCEQAEARAAPIFADFQNLANSALIGRELECDAVYATPTIAALFAEHAQGQGIAGSIKLLALSSETLTAARREELTRAYPNALIANLYASSEIGQFILFPCETMMRAGESRFHVVAEAVAALEILDGELVVSYGLNPAMPLVRYRTGDHFAAVAEGCACGRPGPVLGWSHREAGDRVRINGVEFDVEETDRVFGRLTRIASPNYQVHFKAAPRSGACIVVEIADERLAGSTEAPTVAGLIAQELLSSWKLSSTATLSTVLERGLFDSFAVEFVPALSAQGAKMKRLINHVR